MSTSQPLPAGLALYRFLSKLSRPILRRVLRQRLDKDKEDPARLCERQGEATQERPESDQDGGTLIWVHGASVGESIAVLPLIEGLLDRHPNAHVLLTTGTLTSARLMAKALPPRALHQFVPVDHPRWVAAFLDHWKPDLALFVESELWPNLIIESAARHIPMALLNARLSKTSFKRWRYMRKTARRLLECFSLCLAQDELTAQRLQVLGARQVIVSGNFKFAAPPLSFEKEAYKSLKTQTADRFCWLTASTHEGEEALIVTAHDVVKKTFPQALIIIAPRHPERGAAIVQTLRSAEYSVSLRSNGDTITSSTDIYVADTLGELGLFYRLCPIAFIGGSLIPHGGQNPLEPARLNSAIIHGPHVHNFQDIYEALDQQNAAMLVASPEDLAKAVIQLQDPETHKGQTEQAAHFATSADTVIEDAIEKILPLLDPKLGDRHAAS